MKVWEIKSDRRSFTYNLVNFNEDKEQLYRTEEGRYLLDWKPLRMEVSRKGIKSDLPHFTLGVLVFSRKSVDILNNYINKYVQYLSIDNNEHVLVNITNVADCVNYDRSTSFKDRHGEFAGFDKLYFVEDKLEDQYIFKIKEHVQSNIYVTDKFRDLVLQSKLKGFDFIEVWDSEITEEMEQDKQKNYENRLLEIEQYKGTEYNWSEAIEKVETGKVMASGAWKIQQNDKGIIMLGQLLKDLTYLWIDPIYYPPISLDLKWHEAEVCEI
ncbi:imm11 family protein [Paenibacillus sp. NPDC058174]|uniref:imm11 family protein n=1 Tax=Paenibacillus sp. NPDC058174 TaxID=3346366 RepID=UPI0036D7A25F